MADFTETIVIRFEDCDYDPVNHIARIMCENCGHMNEVEIEIENNEPRFMGFVCENCGTFNAPGD